MSDPHLPAELLDHVVDQLHGTEDALRNCCLVSKSWVPRTRKHLFADISFYTVQRLQSWKKTFPDPSTSPALYTKTLSISCPHVITAADAEAGGWIRGFSQVVELEVGSQCVDVDESTISFVPLHGISPAIKSLDLIFNVVLSSRIFDFILSLPLLENLSVITYGELAKNDDDSDGPHTVIQPSSSPMFTGSLEFFLGAGTEPIVRGLLSLPGGIHFRRLTLTWLLDEDYKDFMALTEKCSHTLESLKIEYLGDSTSTSIDLSKMGGLKDVMFISGITNPEWIVTALRTVTPNHRNLQQISLYAPDVPHDPTVNIADPANLRREIGEAAYSQWLELDQALVQLWESHSIRPKVLYYAPSGKGGEGPNGHADTLLPEVMRRGIIDLVRQERGW